MDTGTAVDGATKVLTLDWTSASIIIGALFLMVVGLIGFLSWQGTKRESRLVAERDEAEKSAREREDKCVDRVRRLEDEMRDRLVSDCALNREAINNCTRTMDDLKNTNHEVISRLCDVIAKRGG